MTTTIVTAPAASLSLVDVASADTITVSDGPAANGYQTTEVTEANPNITTIFANQTSVTINGGGNGNSVVLDNPDPAAGLRSLTVSNLGGTATINGGNPNAASPDIAVPTLTLLAYGGIGTNRALKTQASTLAAEAGLSGSGSINIINGVAAPVTLDIAGMSAIATGGTISLTNNGTIDDTDGILANGLINITTNGATADLNTGSGGQITSNTGSVVLQVGRDVNLGDGVGNGSVSAATGLTWSVTGNITLNGNANVINSTSGNIFVTAGGDITLLTSPGSLANAPGITNNAPTGTISLNAIGATSTLTLNSKGAAAVTSTNGAITLSADAMVINSAVDSGTARTTLAPGTVGEAISLGAPNSPGVLGLTESELGLIDANVLQIGSAAAGNITIASPVSSPSLTLTLVDNGSISQSPFGSLSAANLRVSSTGPVTLNNANNDILDLAASTTNALTVVDKPSINLAIGIVDGTTGITTNDSAVSLTADNMNIAQAINAGTGIVTLTPATSSQVVSLGGADGTGTLGLTSTELGEITASVLRIDAINGNISLGGAVTAPAGFNTLSLATGGAINLVNNPISITNLALNSGDTIDLNSASNVIGTLAFFNASGTVGIADSTAMTIGAVDGITSSENLAGSTAILTGGNLTFATGLFSAGTTTLTSTSGKILDSANGAVDVTTPTLALSASTGIGTSGDPLQTQVTTLNAVTATGGIFINNGSAAPVTLSIGNGGGGIRANGATSGDIVLTNNGTIDSFSVGDIIDGPGNITVKAVGANADINFGNQTSTVTVFGGNAGLIDIEAGRDINLGNSAGQGFVRGGAGSIKLVAGRNLTINANTEVQVLSGSGGITATAGGNISMTTATGTFSGAPEFSTTGGAIALTTGAGGILQLASTGTTAIASTGGNITLTADQMAISQAVNAGAGNVLIQPVTADELIGLGTATGTLDLTSAALNEITAKTLTIGNANAGSIVLAGTVNPAHVTNLTINTGGDFSESAGTAINIGAGLLTIGFGDNGVGDTVDLHNATITAGSVVVNGGNGNDHFVLAASFTGTIGGFHLGDSVDLVNTVANGFSFSNGTLTATENGTMVANIGFSGSLTGGNFRLSTDGNGGTDINFNVPAGDLNGDGKSDVLWEYNDASNPSDPSNGQVAVWLMNGSAPISTQVIQQVPVGWHPITTGDFNGDGKADVLWQYNDPSNPSDPSNGQVAVWLMNGNSPISEQVIQQVPVGWHPITTGDFNGDGKADVLWQYNDASNPSDPSNGQVSIWLMNGSSPLSEGVIQQVPVNWHAVATGDFDGDGKADILWQYNNASNPADPSNGQVSIWLMNGNSPISEKVIQQVPVGWNAVATGDFNGDGKADILWQYNDASNPSDPNNGQVAVWLMNGDSPISEQVIQQVPVGWDAISTGDFNGDGKADILWQYNNASNPADPNNGQASIWMMNGAAATAETVFAQPPSSWHVVPA